MEWQTFGSESTPFAIIMQKAHTDRHRELLFLPALSVNIIQMHSARDEQSRKLKSCEITTASATLAFLRRLTQRGGCIIYLLSALVYANFLGAIERFFPFANAVKWYWWHAKRVQLLHSANVCVWFSLAASDIFASAAANQVTLKRALGWPRCLFCLHERCIMKFGVHFTHKITMSYFTLSMYHAIAIFYETRMELVAW